MSRLDLIIDWAEQARLARYRARELARICGVSCSHLRAYFRAVFGKATQKWLDELRQAQAERLLLRGCLVKEVAYELHYADEAHLCHQFKRRRGVAPLEFVAEHRRNERRRRESLAALHGPEFDPPP